MYKNYQNQVAFLSWYEVKMNTARVNGFQGVQDSLQSIFHKCLVDSPALFDRARTNGYWNVSLKRRELDNIKYDTRFQADFELDGLEVEFTFNGDDNLLKKGLSVLTMKQGQILALFLEGLNFTEIADYFMVSKPAISKSWKLIQKRLKESDLFKELWGADGFTRNLQNSEDYLIRCIDSTL